jgi:hypothetical protein
VEHSLFDTLEKAGCGENQLDNLVNHKWLTGKHFECKMKEFGESLTLSTIITWFHHGLLCLFDHLGLFLAEMFEHLPLLMRSDQLLVLNYATVRENAVLPKFVHNQLN